MDTEDEELWEDEEETEDEEQTDPTLTFYVKNGRIRSKVDGLPAMVQAVTKILSTERFVWAIYSDQYGNDLNSLIGKPLPYVKTEVERMITEALETDERVIEVEITKIEPVARDALHVEGNCTTAYGNVDIETEVELSDAE